MCKRDVVYWVNRWCWTFDPRLAPNSKLPFDLFPRQEEFLQWFQARVDNQEGGLAEKSRDVGFSWLCCAFAVHKWIFQPGNQIGFGSRKLDYVDNRDDPKCIFEKMRYLIRCTETWMLPPGFNPSKHDKYCNLLNPFNGNTITGEGGDSIGRGGRSSFYVVDEAAFITNPKSVDAALSQNTRVRIDVSTPNGSGNTFYKKRMDKNTHVFTFKWQDDPRKDQEWYEREKIRINDPVIIAQELDVDYTASIEGVVIPGRYVMAAVDYPLLASGQRVAGWDVAGEGDNANVIIDRVGPVIRGIHSWKNMDTSQSTYNAIRICKERDIKALNYDVVGLGSGPKGVLNSLNEELQFSVRGVNVGEAPSDTMWQDNKTSKEKFGNLRAELWWRLRDRFRKTYERVLFEKEEEGGKWWPDEECISIPNNGDLIAQLSMPTSVVRENGKFMVESKKDMKKRGVDSPDFADALALSEASMGGGWDQLKQDMNRLVSEVNAVARQINDYPVALGLPEMPRPGYTNW